MIIMQERRAKNKLKSFLNKYCSDKGLKSKFLARQIGLKSAKEMYNKCVDASWSPQEIQRIATLTGQSADTITKMRTDKKRRKVNQMRLFIKNWCNKNDMRGSDFAKNMGLSYNGLFLKIKHQRWTTTELMELANFTKEPFENLVKLSLNEPLAEEN